MCFGAFEAHLISHKLLFFLFSLPFSVDGFFWGLVLRCCRLFHWPHLPRKTNYSSETNSSSRQIRDFRSDESKFGPV